MQVRYAAVAFFVLATTSCSSDKILAVGIGTVVESSTELIDSESTARLSIDIRVMNEAFLPHLMIVADDGESPLCFLYYSVDLGLRLSALSYLHYADFYFSFEPLIGAWIGPNPDKGLGYFSGLRAGVGWTGTRITGLRTLTYGFYNMRNTYAGGIRFRVLQYAHTWRF